MTEEEALAWVEARYDGTAVARLTHLERLVRVEAAEQNLIAPSTLSLMWSRHIVDSVQLDRLAPASTSEWVDVGTGAGFPGLVIACVRPGPIVLVEPRRRRAEFLERAASELSLEHVAVVAAKIETVNARAASVISARAVASIDKLLELTAHIRTPETTYVLPRGCSGLEEVEVLRKERPAMFHVEHSVTDPASIIVIATGVARECTV